MSIPYNFFLSLKPPCFMQDVYQASTFAPLLRGYQNLVCLLFPLSMFRDDLPGEASSQTYPESPLRKANAFGSLTSQCSNDCWEFNDTCESPFAHVLWHDLYNSLTLVVSCGLYHKLPSPIFALAFLTAAAPAVPCAQL
mmetsp:Transcript_44090/g.110435  ORF Transcript_44090/g.110435 Transcript_44090/m.110435 type:complete len:139 (-) Transcript_44090:448-864(-)